MHSYEKISPRRERNLSHVSFSSGWNDRFAGGGSNSVWPWSDLVSAVMRYSKPYSGMRVLELGCGVGANARFFLESGCDYHAIEGSEAAVALMRLSLPELGSRLRQGDFTEGFGFGGLFDVIVDRSAVTHNSHAAIERTLAAVSAALKRGGKYIGIDWFSAAHSDASVAEEAEDRHTRRGFTDGPFTGIGRVHFADEEDMRSLFSSFRLEMLEHKVVHRVQPAGAMFAAWNVVAENIREDSDG